MELRERKYGISTSLLLLQKQPTENQSRNLAISSSSADENNLCKPVYSRYMLHELPDKSSHVSSNTHTTTSDGIAEEKRFSTRRGRKPKMDSVTMEAIQQNFGKPIGEASKRLGVAEGKRFSTRRRGKPKMDSVTMEAIQQNFGKPIGEASKRLGVSHSPLKRVCRMLKLPSWPKPRLDMKYKHLSISVVVLILVKFKHWICGKHSAFFSKPNLTIEAHGSSMISSSSKESDDSKETLNPIPKPPQARSDMFPASPERNVAKVSQDVRTVTVKATYKDDMIKFQFPLSSGLLELKQQVARRFMLDNTRLHLKYRDEDGDLILVACDADLSLLVMPYSATTVGNNTIKLMVEIADD